nr:hypothetical protein [Tanacetum cinerariifolium]
MAALQYKAEHNKVGYLLKPTRSDDYHNIIDFLTSSHIRYALTANPVIFDSLVKQFWSTASLRAPELGPPAILATIDRTPYIITEDLVRSSLQLANDGGVTNLPILEIYSGMDALGYVTKGKLTFFKNKFSPQWRPQSPDLVAHILEHYHSSTQPETAAGSFPFTEDAPLGGDFHTSPLRSSHTPPTGQLLGDAEDPITLTTLSYVVSTSLQKVHSLEADPNVPTGPSNKGKFLMVEEDIPRPQSPDLVAPILEHYHSSTQPETAAGSFPFTEDAPLGGDFHTSPLRSSHTPPTGKFLMVEEDIPRKSLARKHMHKPKSNIPTLDLDAPAKTFLKVMVDEDSDDEDSINEGERVIQFGQIKIYTRFGVGGDISYPLSLELMKKMLLHKLEIDLDFVGNDLTTAKQLI